MKRTTIDKAAMRLSGFRADVSRGYQHGPTAERAGFGGLLSLASTISVSRAIKYAREQRRPLPQARSLWRRAYNAPRTGGLRVHHFVPGVAIALAVGGAAVLTRTAGSELRFAVPFGIGAGLTLDELPLIIDLDNPYWGSEGMAIAQVAGASLGTAALTMRFWSRGRLSARKPAWIPAPAPPPFSTSP